MQVTLTERDGGYRGYAAHLGRRRWTARHNVVTGHWTVTNERGQRLDEFGEIGRKVIEACEEFAEAALDASL